MLGKFNSFGFMALLLAIVTTTALAQRPRAVTNDPSQSSPNTPPPAPATVKAKYEGGILGFPKKKTGILEIDSANSRLTFRDSKQKEMFQIPFGAITAAYADSHSVQPTAATVISNVPTIFSLPARYVKTKVRYLTIKFDDPDSKAAGITSFRLDNKELLDSVLYTVATKAGLIKRGDAYIRKKE